MVILPFFLHIVLTMAFNKKYSVYGICNPLMDFIVYEDFSFLNELGLKSGTMTLISEKDKDKVLAGIKTFKNTPGGSCANTLRGVAFLSQKHPVDQPVYNGVVGNDGVGEKYIHLMETDFGIKALIPKKDGATGCSIAIVTPDYERTMLTYLGASSEFTTDDLDLDTLRLTRYLHLTGYMWGTINQRDAVKKAVEWARAHQCLVSFDLADPFVVSNNRGEFSKWIPKNVDILFGNRDELALQTGKDGSDEEVIAAADGLAPLVVMKTGAKGCFVSSKGSVFFSAGKKVKAVDTVGAGDSFAAGFLFGLLRNKPLPECATQANTLAAGIVGVEGCDYTKLTYEAVMGEA
jgi:sugar/nucleoside kinase (ribokinase family)